MIKNNGFFGSVQGPFYANQQIIDIIQEQCQFSIVYLSKIGIHNQTNYNLDISGKATKQVIILINGEEFVLGKTGILEFDNVQIISLKFKQDVNQHLFIDYQYIGKI